MSWQEPEKTVEFSECNLILKIEISNWFIRHGARKFIGPQAEYQIDKKDCYMSGFLVSYLLFPSPFFPILVWTQTQNFDKQDWKALARKKKEKSKHVK